MAKESNDGCANVVGGVIVFVIIAITAIPKEIWIVIGVMAGIGVLMAVIGKTTSRRGADIVALTTAKLVRVTGAALQNSSDSCRMHFYQSFLAVLSARLTSANVRLVSF